MPKLGKTVATPETQTMAWFEHEIITHTPQLSIFDAASLGIWTIAEQSGQLAGTWKQHRILQQDLDTAKITTVLGEMLAAIAQTAHAIGIPLEAVMQQQVERVHLQTISGVRQRKAPTAPKLPPAPALRVPEPSPAKTTRESMPQITATAQKPRGRPRKTPSVAATQPAAPSVSIPQQLRPTRPRKAHAAETIVPPLPPPTTKQPRRPKVAVAFQLALLNEQSAASTPPPRRKARAAVR